MEEEKIYECGFCHLRMNEADAASHSCLGQSFQAIHIDPVGMFYPVLADNQYMLVPALIDGQIVALETNRQEHDNQVFIAESKKAEDDANKAIAEAKTYPNCSAKKKPAKKLKSSTQLNESEIEILISEVQKRTPLWNFTIPLPLRSKQIKNNLYEEVSQKLNGKLSAHQCQAKFKSLKDTYRKILVSKQQASGAASLEDQSTWKFFEIMNFLKDTCLVQDNTRSNVPPLTDDSMDGVINEGEETEDQPSGYGSNNETDSSAANSTIQRGRRRSSKSTSSNQEEYKTAISKIANFVCQPEAAVVQVPVPELDELESLLRSAHLQLRKLPYEKRMELAMNFTHTVYCTVREHMANSKD